MSSAFYQRCTLFFESGKRLTVLSLHTEGSFGEKSAAYRADFVDGTGIFNQEWTGGMSDEVIVFCFVCFPHFAQLFK